MLRPLAFVFLLVALPTSITLALLTPPGQVSDEPSHIARADGLRLGQIVAHRDTVTGPVGTPIPMGGVLADPGPVTVATFLPAAIKVPPSVDFKSYYTPRAVAWTNRPAFMAMGSIALYFPVLYIPGAITLAAAKALGASPLHAILAGRVVNALCFVIIGLATLQIARRARALMFCALAVPMTLSLAGSFNPDGLLIAFSALAAALTTRAAKHDRAVAAVIIGCLAAIKLPYLPLAVLLMAPLPRTGTWRASRAVLLRRAALVVLVAVPALLWTGWMVATVATPTPRLAYTAGPLWPGDPAQVFDRTDVAAQLSVLLAAPGRLLTLPVLAVIRQPWLLWQAIGVLGWLNLVLPNLLYRIWVAALCLAVVADTLNAGDDGPRWSETVLYLAAALACAWLVLVSQYLTWTNVGMDHIEGAQGRYFLPLVPLAALAMPRPHTPFARWIARACALGPVAAACAGILLLPPAIVAAYYVH